MRILEAPSRDPFCGVKSSRLEKKMRWRNNEKVVVHTKLEVRKEKSENDRKWCVFVCPHYKPSKLMSFTTGGCTTKFWENQEVILLGPQNTLQSINDWSTALVMFSQVGQRLVMGQLEAYAGSGQHSWDRGKWGSVYILMGPLPLCLSGHSPKQLRWACWNRRTSSSPPNMICPACFEEAARWPRRWQQWPGWKI